jgi:hypothetical protein
MALDWMAATGVVCGGYYIVEILSDATAKKLSYGDSA